MEAKAISNIINDVSCYYSNKVEKHGPTPLGVDWNSKHGQDLRFEKLSIAIQKADYFTINDLGCGYGAYYKYLSMNYKNFSYYGYDISSSMIATARHQLSGQNDAEYIVASEPLMTADYSIASGIFNVRLDHDDMKWWLYIEKTLDSLNAKSIRAFSFNCLTHYSDRDKMKEYLFYADPCKIFDHCKKKYSNYVALFHDYELYEFTIVVRKTIE